MMAMMLANAFKPTGAPPTSASLYTPDMLDRAIRSQLGFKNESENFFATPSYSAGGVMTTQASKTDPDVLKKQGYIQYLQASGMSKAEAANQAAKVLASGKGFSSDKNFATYVGQGAIPGLSLGANGGIKAQSQVIPGGISVSPESDALRAAMNNVSLQSMQALNGLPAMYGQEAQNSEAFRQAARNQLGQQALNPYNQNGLTAQGQGDIDATTKNYLNQFADVYRNSMQQTIGSLAQTGFSSSNLASKALEYGAQNAQSRFLSDAMANIANQRQNILNSQSARQAQSQANTINALNSAGGLVNIGGITAGIMNPANAGVMTDAQSAQLAMQQQQQNYQNRFGNQQAINQMYMSPTTAMSGSGSGMGSSIGALVGGIAGTIVAPGIGTAIGAGLGGAAGGLVGGAVK